MDPVDFIVVGGGVSGLGVAASLKARGWQVLLLEGKPRLGGMAQTLYNDAYVCEVGPNLLCLTNPDGEQLLHQFGLLATPHNVTKYAAKRYVYRDGRMQLVPSSLLGFLTTGMLSWNAKISLLKEPFCPRSLNPEETVAEFVRRHLGSEFLEELVDPFVRAAFGGDPERLAVSYALPWLQQLEREYGGIVRGVLKTGARPFFERRLLTWSGGFSEMISGLEATLKNEVRTSQVVQSIRRVNGGFEVQTNQETLASAGVIVATDVVTAGRMVNPLVAAASGLLTVPRASVAVVHLGYRRSVVNHSLDGMGLFIGRSRGLRTLAVLFSSSLCPARVPSEYVLLTARVGGVSYPDVMNLKDDALVKLVAQELAGPLQTRESPTYYNVVRWPGAFPQYERDHARVEDACQVIERECPGLYLLGNYRGGIWVDDCLGNAHRLSQRLGPKA